MIIAVDAVCLDHTSSDQRCCLCSCCCPFSRTLDLYFRRTRCLSTPLSSTCVSRCRRTECLRCRMCLSCRWQSSLHFFPTSSSISRCKLKYFVWFV